MNISETIQAIDLTEKAGYITTDDAVVYIESAIKATIESQELELAFNKVNFEAIKPKTAGEFPKITIASNV